MHHRRRYPGKSLGYVEWFEEDGDFFIGDSVRRRHGAYIHDYAADADNHQRGIIAVEVGRDVGCEVIHPDSRVTHLLRRFASHAFSFPRTVHS